MNIQDAYYRNKLENAFLRSKGEAFQAFFEKLMGLAYKADFMACTPWGRVGDCKNDGFLKSERRLFQVYAPREMKAADAKKKIAEDFAGALKHWKKHFHAWSFVHNAHDGLPPHVQALLLDLEASNPGVVIEPWGWEELLVVFRRLDDKDKAELLGPAPTEAAGMRLGYADLCAVLESIAARTTPRTEEVGAVPMGKIEANALSESVATLLKAGMRKTSLVKEFFNQWHDETLGERVAAAFKAEYQRLRPMYAPNDVFSRLQDWAGGTQRGGPEHELAVLTVIAYYFESCDIFEKPRGVVP